jgi:large subunit ribosomal protein L18
MSIERKLRDRKLRRQLRVRRNVKAHSAVRISVFRSLKHIYGQVIDDNNGITLVSCSTKELATSGEKSVQAKVIGVELAKRALSKGISQAAFDRGPYLYHGRVKQFVEGLREGGLKI